MLRPEYPYYLGGAARQPAPARPRDGQRAPGEQEAGDGGGRDAQFQFGDCDSLYFILTAAEHAARDFSRVRVYQQLG